MAETQSFDVVVIGSGPGGYVAAIRAAQLGLKTACIERAELGGICLNWGCIPTKALLHSAHLRQEIAHAEVHGFTIGDVQVQWDKLIARSRGVAKRLSRGVGSLFKKYAVTLLTGEARIERPGVVLVGEERLEAKHIVVATGARPRPLPGIEFDGKVVWTSREAMVSADAPESLLIIGAGAIGAEFAYFYNAFGTKVTLVEMADRILPIEDDDCSAALRKSFEKQGIVVKTKTVAKGLKVVDGHVEVRLVTSGEGGEAEESMTVDRVLVAIGVVGNTEGLGLSESGVELERGNIKIDRHGQTTCPGIWAIGDVAGPPWLAHKASAEGVHVAEAIAAVVAGKKPAGSGVAIDNIPGCTYCEPQVASVGLTERALKAQGIPYKSGKFPYVGNGKALALEDKEGFAKVLFHAETGALLGAHLFGTAATELIAESVLVRQAELTEADIMASVHAHPTLSEAFAEAVGLAFGHSVNL